MDDNTFECPNCGAVVYPEMTRCPQCGHNMYPEDDESPSAAEETATPSWLSVVGALAIGWMIACGLALLLHFIVSTFNHPDGLGLPGKIILALAGPLGALLGSYIAAGIARPQARWLGALVALLSLPVLLVYATHWVMITPSFLLSAWAISSALLTLLAGALGGWLSYKFSQDTAWKEQWKVRGWEDLLYQDLLRKARFNGSTADRLIEYERRQNPAASRFQLIQSAIERWERDNR